MAIPSECDRLTSLSRFMLQPPTPETPLAEQLDAFATTLGYEPGDRLYVRALLPKHLSDEVALKQGLKFEIEEHGKND